MFYDYKKEGIWQLGEEAAAAANGQEPGDIKVQDVDGNGVITTDDRIIYSQRPDVTFGFNNTFNYKGLICLYSCMLVWVSGLRMIIILRIVSMRWKMVEM